MKDVLGENLWYYISATMASPGGLNLRNKFAHGLARLAHCTPETVGITLHLLFCLVAIRRELTAAGSSEGTA